MPDQNKIPNQNLSQDPSQDPRNARSENREAVARPGSQPVNPKTGSVADVPAREEDLNKSVRPVTQHDLDTLPHLKENKVNVGDSYDFSA